MTRVPVPGRSQAEAMGLATAARLAAAPSGEIATAGPDPLLVAELTDRAPRVPARLFAVPSPRLTAAVLADTDVAHEAPRRPRDHRPAPGGPHAGGSEP
ncbi:hypothetical protein [Pseudofrankia asymbiotica]|uniref:Uncharacterized protein n=1 Tax=Pseudofrankia asymbiotica TaxID=1834516 RepID=A0A1V2IK78_9ACTN|nr:hypothetical protein [Pseudofrankia asymbiotica]ONH32856.1 hypothetical protein BL253_03835 [Pseudofrankia asymbiotica]